MKFTWKRTLHFLPFAIFQIYALIGYFIVSNASTPILYDSLAASLQLKLAKQIEEYATIVSNLVYTILGYRELKSYQAWLHTHTADSTYPDFHWLWKLFVVVVVLGVFLALNQFLQLAFRLSNKYSVQWDALNVYMAFVIYYLGFVGYKQSSHTEIAIHQTDKLTSKDAPNIATQEIQQVAQRLQSALVNDQLFLNPTLSLQEVAQLLAVNPRNLSHVINSYFGKSFRELINHYRVEEVKAKLNDENLAKHSILGIALDCGFNSEASFYRIFKKATGMSPSQYKNHQATQ